MTKGRTPDPRSVTPLQRLMLESGITLEHLERLKIVEVKPGGDRAIPLPVPAARIEYFDLDGSPSGHYRLRLLVEARGKDGKLLRYRQPTGSGNRFYLPPILARSWREIAADPAVEIIFTEGEKKAVSAGLRGFATIGLGGVWSWKAKAEGGPISDFSLITWTGRRVFIVFDSDIYENPQVQQAADALAGHLRQLGAHVSVVLIPPEGNKKIGLDDFIVAAGDDAALQLRDLLNSGSKWVNHVAILNRELALVTLKGVELVLREPKLPGEAPEFARPEQVRPRYANRYATVEDADGNIKKVSPFDVWMRSAQRRDYDGVVFEPRGAEKGYYNLYGGPALKAADGDCALLLRHILEVICSGDEAVYLYVLGWCAHLVQKPWELPGVAIALRSGQGTGKGSFVRALGMIWGKRHFRHVADVEHLLGRFNAHLENAILVYCDEAYWAGDKHHVSALKAMITETTRIIERKGVNAMEVNNLTRLIIATNNRWAVPAELDDRRFLVLEVSDARVGQHDYFEALHHELENGGAAGFLQFLLEYDIGGFSPYVVPKTTALLEAKVYGMDAVGQFIFDMLLAGVNLRGGWEREVPTAVLQAAYMDSAHAVGHLRRASETMLGKRLMQLVPGVKVTRKTLARGEPQTKVYLFPDLEAARAAFAVEVRAESWDQLRAAFEGQGSSPPSSPSSLTCRSSEEKTASRHKKGRGRNS